MLFAGTAAIIHVIKMDGTLKNTIADGCYDFVEDIGRGEIIGIIDAGPGGVGKVNFFGLGTDGTDVFDGALEDGVDPVVMEEEDQCLTEDEINTAYQEMNKICLTCHTLSDIVNPTPVGSNTIYYGNSATGALDAAGVSALTAITKVGIAGTYTYPLGGGTEYLYFAYPTNLGIPTRMYDPATNFDIAMQASTYQVIINYITYTVYRSFYRLGGGFDMTVTT